MQVRILPCAPEQCRRRLLVRPSVLQADLGEFDSHRRYHSCTCSPTGRDTGFRFQVLGVRIPPGVPFNAPVAQRQSARLIIVRSEFRNLPGAPFASKVLMAEHALGKGEVVGSIPT